MGELGEVGDKPSALRLDLSPAGTLRPGVSGLEVSGRTVLSPLDPSAADPGPALVLTYLLSPQETNEISLCHTSWLRCSVFIFIDKSSRSYTGFCDAGPAHRRFPRSWR